jgi:hypothetical protein
VCDVKVRRLSGKVETSMANWRTVRLFISSTFLITALAGQRGIRFIAYLLSVPLEAETPAPKVPIVDIASTIVALIEPLGPLTPANSRERMAEKNRLQVLLLRRAIRDARRVERTDRGSEMNWGCMSRPSRASVESGGPRSALANDARLQMNSRSRARSAPSTRGTGSGFGNERKDGSRWNPIGD